MFQRLHDVFTKIAKPWISGGQEPRERVHDCQNTYLSPGDQLVVYKIHCPSLIAMCRFNAPLAKLRFDTPFWCLGPQLKAFFGLTRPHRGHGSYEFLELSFDNVLQQGFIQREIRHEPPQSGVFLVKHLQTRRHCRSDQWRTKARFLRQL